MSKIHFLEYFLFSLASLLLVSFFAKFSPLFSVVIICTVFLSYISLLRYCKLWSLRDILFMQKSLKQNLKQNILSRNSELNILSQILDCSSIPYLLLDSDFKSIWSNKNFNLMKSDFLIYDDFLQIFDKDFLNEILVSFKNNDLNSKSPFEIKLRDTGFILLIYFNKFTFKEQNFLLISIFDITQNKMLEADFVHLQKLQILGHFLSSVIHDFNNLLTAIIGFSDILLTKNPASSNSYEDIIQIKQNAIRSSNLVKKLLAFSRKEVILPTLVNVNTCISDMYHLLRKLLGEKISLSIETKEDACFIKIDKTQFEQIIINLAINAKDAIAEKGTNYEGNFKITTQLIDISEDHKICSYFSPTKSNSLNKGQYVLVKVKDNGQGMNQSILEKIFDPFFSTKNQEYGTGLGLSTINDIVESSKGYIKVKTEKSLGTSFFLLFKPEKSSVNYENSNTSKDTFSQFKNIANMENNKNIKILVVEDENSVRLVTSQALKYNGYEVFDTNNGSDALQILSKHPEISLVITDFMMSRMDGIELVKNIRKKYKEIKIIITSGYTETALSYVKEYKCFFLSKPYSLKNLNEKVSEILLKDS